MNRALAVWAAAVAVFVASPRDGLAQKKQRDVITREEIKASPYATVDAFTAINSLRPHFFQAPRTVKNERSGAEDYPLAIYIGHLKQSGTEILKDMMANQIQEARYYDPSRAQSEFGKTANSGAVQVILVDEKRDTTKAKPPK